MKRESMLKTFLIFLILSQQFLFAVDKKNNELKITEVKNKYISIFFKNKTQELRVWNLVQDFYNTNKKVKLQIQKLKKINILGKDMISYYYSFDIINPTKDTFYLNVKTNDKVSSFLLLNFNETKEERIIIKKKENFLKVKFPYFKDFIIINKEDRELITEINNSLSYILALNRQIKKEYSNREVEK